MTSPFVDRLQELLGDRFVIDRELGGGGMSRVFVATETALRRAVVVKVLPPELVSEKNLRRFSREIETTVSLQHPHILPLITAGGRDDILFHVTPYVQGQSLRRRLTEGHRPSFDEAIAITRELLSAVAFAHARGIVHRDIKPANVLIAEGHAVLADFGIAQAFSADGEEAPPSGSIDDGSAYSAPEGSSNPRSDLYAVAAVLHVMLTGVAPHPGAAAGTIADVLRQQHPVVAPARRDRVARTLAAALDREPARRPDSAMAFSQLLAAPSSATPVRRVVLAAALVVVAVGATLVVRGLRSRPPAAGGSVSGAVAPTAFDTPRPALDTGAPASAIAPTATVIDATPPLSVGDSARWLVEHARAEEALALVRGADSTGTGDARSALVHAVLSTVLSAPTEISEEPRIAIERALAGRSSLRSDEAALAAGWRQLTDGAYPDAIRSLRTLASDHRIASWAWTGVAEAVARDDRVDSAAYSPSGFAFRTNWNDGARAIASALRATPKIDRRLVFTRLFNVRPPQDGRLRPGHGVDGANFVARMQADGDSVQMIPYPVGARTFLPPPGPEGRRAVELMRAESAPQLAEWRREAPSDPAAWALTAELLESSGNVRVAGNDGVTALQAIDRAVALARSDAERVRRIRDKARMLLRAGEYAAVASLARQSLSNVGARPLEEQDMLLPLVVVAGRITLATTMLERLSGLRTRQMSGPDGLPVHLTPELQRARSSFLVSASYGLCDESVRGAPARLRQLADAQFEHSARPAWFDFALLQQPLELGQLCTGAAPLAAMTGQVRPINRAAAQLVAGDTDSVRRLFEGMDRAREARGAPPVGPDAALGEALMRLAIGDSLGALAQVRAAINALPVMSNLSYSREAPMASIGRALVLAARLDAQAEPIRAREWLVQAEALWADADAPVRAQLAELRSQLRAGDGSR